MEILSDPNVKHTQLNRSQALIQIINANTTYCPWARASGKTSGGIGPRINRLSQVMPRSQVLLVSDKFERIHDVLVPGIEQYWRDELGLVDGWDYVMFRKPPEHFTRPLFPLNKYDHVISFATGVALCGVSLKVSGSANGYNGQALIGDEAKFFQEMKMKTEVFPAVRGGKKFFGHLPEFQSKWYFTDKWGENIQWILKKKSDCDFKRVDVVYALQMEVFRLEAEMENFSSLETIYKYKSKIEQIEAVLRSLRMDLVYYCDAKPYENIEVLGEKYFRDLRRDLTKYEYEVAIENMDPDRAVVPFYPDLNGSHFYTGINDYNPHKPLIIALDYQFAITPLCVAQFDKLPDSAYTTLNFLQSLHTLHPQSITDALDRYCDHYIDHPIKVVYYIYDHTAIGRSPYGTTFKDTVVDYLFSKGWSVVEVYTGDAPDHDIKYEVIKKWFNSKADKAVRINEERNKFLKKALELTSAIIVSGKTKKDKSGERSAKVPPEEATHYPDTFDHIVWGACELNLVPMSDDIGMDITMK